MGEQFEGRVERIVPGGLGLVRGPRGAVLVESAAPGDRGFVEIVATLGGAPRGRLLQVLEPGPGRVAPPCPHVGVCGGCDFQHLAYEAQMSAKVDMVRDAFARIGKLDLPQEIDVHHAPHPFGSRTRVEIHVDRDAGTLGFFQRHSTEVVDVETCLVARPEINRALGFLRGAKQPLPRSIHLLAAPGTVHSAPALPPIAGGSFWVQIDGNEFLIDPGSFFQSNLDLLPELIATVIDSAGHDRHLAWDLFAGGGLFSIPLASRFERVHGVDSDRRAITCAMLSAQRNQVANARFTVADVRDWVSGRKRADVRPGLIVADPPRSGLGTALATMLAHREPERFTYVSCDPATLARDLKVLTALSLRIHRVAIFDLFPQTHHVETVVQLAGS